MFEEDESDEGVASEEERETRRSEALRKRAVCVKKIIEELLEKYGRKETVKNILEDLGELVHKLTEPHLQMNENRKKNLEENQKMEIIEQKRKIILKLDEKLGNDWYQRLFVSFYMGI